MVTRLAGASSSASRASGSFPGGLPMNDVRHILSAIERGGLKAAEQLLPPVDHELRRLAAQRLDREKFGQTLQATA